MKDGNKMPNQNKTNQCPIHVLFIMTSCVSKNYQNLASISFILSKPPTIPQPPI